MEMLTLSARRVASALFRSRICASPSASSADVAFVRACASAMRSPAGFTAVGKVASRADSALSADREVCDAPALPGRCAETRAGEPPSEISSSRSSEVLLERLCGVAFGGTDEMRGDAEYHQKPAAGWRQLTQRLTPSRISALSDLPRGGLRAPLAAVAHFQSGTIMLRDASYCSRRNAASRSLAGNLACGGVVPGWTDGRARSDKYRQLQDETLRRVPGSMHVPRVAECLHNAASVPM